MTDDVPSPGRRAFLAALGTGVTGGLAGCPADGTDTGGSPGSDTGSTGGRGEDLPSSGEALESSDRVLGHAFPHVPEEYELNPWARGYLSGFTSLLFEYPAVRRPDGSWEPTDLVDDVEISGTEVRLSYSDQFSWWNGEPVTARDRWIGHRIDGGIGTRAREFDVELVDEYTLRYTFPSPRRRRILADAVFGSVHNTPAWLYEEWVSKLSEATTDEERSAVRSSLRSTSVGLEDAAERGIGCGPYELGEVSPNRLVLDRFENHPNADRIAIPRLWFPVARGMRADELTDDGVLDLGQRVLRPNGNPKTTPSHIEQLDEHATTLGTRLLFNWRGDHLARRNVRRAVASVLPLPLIERETGWGQPATLQTGLATTVEDGWLDDSLRERLYQYPVESDEATAAEFMRRAGYEKPDRWWIDPDGAVAEIQFQSPLWGEWAGAASVVKSALREFGVRLDTDLYSASSFLAKARHGNYQLSAWTAPETPFTAFDVTDDSLSGLGYGVTDPDRETAAGRPVEPTIPDEPGDLEVSGSGTTVNLVDLWNELREPIAAERSREIVALFVRWWNYDLPDLQLATMTTGVWGNTRDFDWPASDSDVYRKAGPDNRFDYHLLRSGAIEPGA